MAQVDRLERLTNLVLVLLDTPRPLTLQEIADSVAGYPESAEARRQAFERDKRLLREEGVPIVVEPIKSGDRLGYRIRPDDYYLPELALSPEEQAALNLAVAGIHLSDRSGREGLLKLGILEDEGGPPYASIPSVPSLGLLHQAIRDRAAVRFTYRNEERVVDPHRLVFRGGWWYLIGHDHERRATRTFRVDRMETEPVADVPGTARTREDSGVAAEVLAEPWRFGDGQPVIAEVRVEPPLAVQVAAELGPQVVAGEDETGAITLRLEVANREAFRSWVVGLLDHAEVVGPPDLREEVTDWLVTLAGSAASLSPGGSGAAEEGLAIPGPPPGVPHPALGRGGDARDGDPPQAVSAHLAAGGRAGSARPVGSEPRSRGPSGAAERLRLLLAVLPWLAARGPTPTAQLAGRLGLEETEVVSLLELAACCGLPPYTPDRLMELIVDDGWVSADLGPHLARPRRLTPAEGFALAASARAILAVPGSDPDGALARALGKLEAALGADQPVMVELDEPPLLAEIRAAVAEGRPLEVDYYAASTDELSVRQVEPREVFAAEGHWYLDAYCHLAQGRRRFRVDRILSARPATPESPLGSEIPHALHGAPPLDAPRAGQDGGRPAFVPGPETRPVVLLVPPSARWVAEAFPVERVTARRDGDLEITLAVSGRAWLARLLLRLGPVAKVLDPPELASAGQEAAGRILDRYRAGTAENAEARSVPRGGGS